MLIALGVALDARPPAVAAPPVRFVRLWPGVPRPSGVAVASDGRVVVTDATTPLAKVLLPSGQEMALLPTVGNPDEPAAAPFGVAVDEAGDIYVSDASRRDVVVYRNGEDRPSPFAGPEWEGRMPGALFARDGKLYVCDLASQQVIVIDIKTEKRTAIIGAGEGSGAAQMRYPNGVWADSDGTVYVADTNNDRILRFRPDGGAVAPEWRGSFRNPRGLAGDGNGRFFVASTLAHEILVLDGAGEVIASVIRADTREIGFPTGLAVAGDRLFVTDRDAHGVFEWRLTEGRRAP